MNRVLTITLLLSLGLASAAPAATLGTDFVTGLTYTSGDPITIDIVATITPPEPNALFCCDVRLLGSGAISWSGATQTTLTSFDGGLTWTSLSPICSGGDPCIAVNQVNPIIPAGAQPDPFDGVLATATGTIVGAPGTYEVELQGIDFFGQAPTSSTMITIVPEPTTAALLGLGLLGLVLAAPVVNARGGPPARR